MKIEDFKVGETYLYDGQYEEKVLHIIRQQKKIVTINLKREVWVFEENELENFKPLKEKLPEEGLLVSKNGTIVYLELVTKAVQEIGYFFIEQTESGIIILTPIKK